VSYSPVEFSAASMRITQDLKVFCCYLISSLRGSIHSRGLLAIWSDQLTALSGPEVLRIALDPRESSQR
jgi:hypothetical protein